MCRYDNESAESWSRALRAMKVAFSGKVSEKVVDTKDIGHEITARQGENENTPPDPHEFFMTENFMS